MLFHASRLIKYHGKNELAMVGYRVWKVLFVLARALTVVVSVQTLWFGLGREEAEQEGAAESEEDEEAAWPREFNTPTFRSGHGSCTGMLCVRAHARACVCVCV